MRKRFILLMLVSTSVLAKGPEPIGTDYVYYEVGGGASIPSVTHSNKTNIPFGVSAEMHSGSVCSKFSPEISLKNALNDMADIKRDIGHSLVDTARGAIMNLGPYHLAKADPTLFNIFKHALLSSQDNLSLATKSCQDMERDVQRGDSPFEGVIKASTQSGWKKQISLGGDVIQAKKNIEKQSHEDGVLWVNNERKGGRHQAPINVISDTTAYAYEKLHQESVKDDHALWRSEAELKQWIVDVVGDYQLQTYQPDNNKVVAGRGLIPKIDKDKQDIYEKLGALISGDVEINEETLLEVSAYGVYLNHNIIYSLREMTANHKKLYMSRISEDVAISKNLQRALDAKHILNLGYEIPQAQQIDSVQHILKRAIERLDSEMQDVMQTVKIRRELVSQTVLSLLNEQDRNATAIISNLNQSSDSALFDAGALGRSQ